MKQVKWLTAAVFVGLSTAATVNLSAASQYTWEYRHPLQEKLTREQRLERQYLAISGKPQQIEPQQRYIERCLLPPALPMEVKPVLLARSEALTPTPAVLKVYALAKEQPLLPTSSEVKPNPSAAVPSKVPQAAQAGVEKLTLAKAQPPLPKPPEVKPNPSAAVPSKVPQAAQAGSEKLTLAKAQPPLPKPPEAKPKPTTAISEEEKLDSKLYGAITPVSTQKIKTPPPPPTLVPIDVRAIEEAPVNVALERATLREIVLALAPTGWKVTIDSARPEIKEGRWNFYTSTQRREALADLLSPLNLTYRLFPDFKDKVGNPAPLLLVGDTHITGEVEYNDYE